MFLIFTDVSLDFARKDQMGFMLILTIGFNIIIIVLVAAYNTAIELKKQLFEKVDNYKFYKNKKAHISNQALIIKEMPGMFPKFFEHIEED